MNILQKTSSDGSSIAGVGVQGLDDFLDGDRGMTGPPSVKVGGSTDQGVAIVRKLSSETLVEMYEVHLLDLGLTGELSFGDDGHVDDVSAPLPVHD